MTAAPAGARSRATVVGQSSRRARNKRRVRFWLKVLGYTPHVLLVLFFAVLGWRFLGGSPPSCSSPLDGPPSCPPLVQPSEVDVVTVALAPTCVGAAAVASLNRNLAPRRLFVVTHRNASCAFYTALAPNVRCLVDDAVMPGLTRSLIGGVLQKVYGFKRGTGTGGRDTLLKLGAPLFIPDLSSRFLLWDSDMLALRPLNLTDGAGRVRRHTGGSRSSSYNKAYARLTGAHLRRAKDGSSFVTHHMVVETATLRAMLAVFAASQPAKCADPGGAGGPRAAAMPRWAAAILCSLDADHLHTGFSEYASYASFFAESLGPGASGQVAVVPAGAWTRHPFNWRTSVVFSRLWHPSGLCCPTRALLANAAAKNPRWEFTGFEVGHHARLCSYDRRTHSHHGYGHNHSSRVSHTVTATAGEL